MATKRKRNKGVVFFAIAVPFVLLIAYFAVKPDRWYLLTAGTGRQEISVKKNKGTMEEYSLEHMQANENFQFNQSMMLINTDYRISDGFVAETTEYKDSGVEMNACITAAYGALCDFVKAKTGDKLYVSSAIRSRSRQQELYEEDPETAMVPGASEHQTGLCLDFMTSTMTDLDNSFAETDAFEWLVNNAYRFGFILRYPKEKEGITG